MKIIPMALTLILPIGICFAQKSAQPPQSGAGESQSAQAQSKAPVSSRANETDAASLGKSAQKFKGTLVDAACARTGAAPSPGGQSSADRAASPNASSSEKGGANRQPSGAESCAASANTTEFGLRLNDGRTLHFDSVGSERVKEGLKSKKKWADAAASGKAIRSTVHGVESGDTLMALSVD